MHGTIVKGIGGFYYVRTQSGVVECRARGKFRSKKLSPAVGDNVVIRIGDDGTGSIESIDERKNLFVRPPVANIDALIIVASVCNPAPDLTFIDKMLVIAEKNNLDVTICFNKFDLSTENVNDLVNLYMHAGYRAVTTSTVENIGIDVIRAALPGKTTAFAGFSGVGKSSLMNSVLQRDVMQTGSVSERLRRGKHTTRHVELVEYTGGYIVDTPGFSMLTLPDEIESHELSDLFPEFSEFVPECRFRGCLHTGDSIVCAVHRAVEDGRIAQSRYDNYLRFLKSITDKKIK